jgi:hypothetical protein
MRGALLQSLRRVHGAHEPGDMPMPHNTLERRKEVEERLRLDEQTLAEARNSAALGGNSKAMLLHLERGIHECKKSLAEIDAQLAAEAEEH